MTCLMGPFATHLSCCQLFAYCRNCLLRNVYTLSSVAISHDNAGDCRSFSRSDAHLCRLAPVTKRYVASLHSPNVCRSTRSVLSTTKTGLRWSVGNWKSALTRTYSRLRPNVPWLTLSPKAIVEASPLYIQPYLRLIRLDRPIGMNL